MALTGKTNTRRQQEVAAQNGNNRSYNGMVGVNDNTARNVANYQAGYTPSQTVQQAQQQLQQVQSQRPQGYNSKYSGQLDNILQQIQNPKEFKYSFDGDEMFKYYADLYTQKGKQASMDAMGQAAALTGGYGNSYGQMVGQQQYQQNLLPLYDMGLQLRDRAYQQYQDQLGNAKDAYQLTGQAEDRDYAMYRDLLGDWERELDRAREDERYEREFDYNDYRAQQDYWTGLAQVENAAYETEQQRLEAIRQYNQDFEERVREFDADLAEQIREYDESLSWDKQESARDFAQRQYEYNTDNTYRYDVLDWDKQESNRDFAQRQYEYNTDNTYRYDMLDWDKEESARDFAQRQYEYNTDNDYRNRYFDWQQSTDARDYAEQVRQADLDEAYRQSTLAEQIRQADLDEAFRQAQFGWQRDTDARDFNESVRQSDQKLAYNYAMAILANGQMPSAEMLAAAGLSEDDARKLMAQMMITGSVGGGPGRSGTTPDNTQGNTTGKQGSDNPFSFYDANLAITNATLDMPNLPSNVFNQNMAKYGATMGEAKANLDAKVQNLIANKEAQKPTTNVDVTRSVLANTPLNQIKAGTNKTTGSTTTKTSAQKVIDDLKKKKNNTKSKN